MSSLSSSLVLARNSPLQLSSGSFQQGGQCLGSLCPTTLSFTPLHTRKAGQKPLVVQASYSDGGRFSSTGVFIGGFILGGLVVGTLSCVYAPQVSNALAGADRKDLMKKLPKFIYDEEKALEKTKKVLTEKIAQLNSAIDNVSSKLRPEDDAPSGTAVSSDEHEATV